MAHRDVDVRLISVLPQLYALTSSDRFPGVALAVVRELLGGDKGIWTEVNRSTGDFYTLIDPVPAELDALQAARVEFMAQHPVMQHVYRSPASADARLISDFLTTREFHRLALYGEFFALLDVEDQITVPLRATRHRLAGVSVDRGRFGFTEEDRKLLDQLQPHLVAAHQNSLAYSRALTGQSDDADGPASSRLGRLTSRQLDILELIASGCTNRQIANELDVSFDTVRTHIENILRRLEVPNRAAAAVCLFEARRAPATHWTATVPGMLAPVP